MFPSNSPSPPPKSAVRRRHWGSTRATTSRGSPARSTNQQRRQQRPLDGIRVLDLGAIIAGPFAASLLGDLGADVIKVEPPSGDSFRGPGFAAYNKGQRSIVLDLRDANDKETFLQLVGTADVVIDNYRPGVLGRLGIAYEQLRDVNPTIVLCRSPASVKAVRWGARPASTRCCKP